MQSLLTQKRKTQLRGVLYGCIPFIGVVLAVSQYIIPRKAHTQSSDLRKYILIGAILSKPFWGIVYLLLA